MPEGAPGKYFIGRIRGGDAAAIGSIPEGTPQVAMWNTYVWVDSADETATKAAEAGGAVVPEPFDIMDSGRMAMLTDPEGAAFCVWQAGQHKGAQVVNEHGALNFNGLATRDVEAAAAFYGAVFGWRTLALPAGMMWTLPGYGDHLEERSPGLRDQMAQMAAPDGFIDVVAALNPIAADDTETPAALERHLRRRRRPRHGGEGGRAGGRGRRRSRRRPVEPAGRDQGPAGRDVHRQPVRLREQGPRGVANASRHSSSGSSRVSSSRYTPSSVFVAHNSPSP